MIARWAKIHGKFTAPERVSYDVHAAVGCQPPLEAGAPNPKTRSAWGRPKPLVLALGHPMPRGL